MIAALLLAFGTGIVSAQILNFRTIFRVGGAIAVADRLGPQIDRTLTTVTGQRHLAGQDSATKIVPVLSVGDRQAVEIVQVSGSRDAVARTHAVVQVSTRVPVIGGSQARVLIPINTRNAT